MGYKILGFIVWQGGKWYLRRRVSGKKAWFPTPELEKIAAHIKLPGRHNRENAMAAAAAVEAVGVSRAKIERALRTFKGVPHRIETVLTRGGVRYVNDSKSTNVDSTTVALKSFDEPLLLILGGEHKGSPYVPLRPLVKRNVKRIFTIGEAAPLVKKDLGGVVPVQTCGTLRNAVKAAAKTAEPGDVVLLSPACASFDQFRNYEHRGEEFARIVREVA